MSSINGRSSQTQSPPVPRSSFSLNWKNPLFLWCSAAVVLLIAVYLHATHPIPPLSHLARLIPFLSLKPYLLPSLHRSANPPTNPRPPCVRWMAPFLSGGGYSSEAWSFISALHKTIKDPQFTINIDHHGDRESLEFWHGLPDDSKALAFELHNNNKCRMKDTIVICHSEPGAWSPPLFQTLPCPPIAYNGEEPAFVVGRTMFETDRLNPEHFRRCNRMDAIWVPTEFHVSVFVRSGVDRSKLVKVVQAVDVDFFDPSKHNATVFSTRIPVIGSELDPARKRFVFLSVFKWEYRKGWDVLLKSYLQEFSQSDAVSLYLLINAYHSNADFRSKITAFVEESRINEPENGWALIYLIDTHVPQIELPGVYKASDAFVLPSRGEGWGRPIVEAMAMGLPVIATNWSGPTEYLTEENGYPLAVDRMSEVAEGPFEGHLWAEPSVERLRLLMRHLVRYPEEGRRRGRRAREVMMERFSPEVVARIVADQISEIWKNATIGNP